MGFVGGGFRGGLRVLSLCGIWFRPFSSLMVIGATFCRLSNVFLSVFFEFLLSPAIGYTVSLFPTFCNFNG